MQEEALRVEVETQRARVREAVDTNKGRVVVVVTVVVAVVVTVVVTVVVVTCWW